MKLYATTISERASKGQGGNDYLDITITRLVNKKITPVYCIHVLENELVIERIQDDEEVYRESTYNENQENILSMIAKLDEYGL